MSSQDDHGAEVETWEDYDADVPCAVEHAGSREFPLTVKRFAESVIRFIVRYRDDIDPATMRIKYAESPDASPIDWRYYDIKPPQHIQGRRSFTSIEGSETQ